MSASEGSSANTYVASKIKVLPPLEHIRARSAMYIGGVDSYGLHRLLTSLIDSSIGQVPLGRGTKLGITLEPGGWIAIDDDAPGIEKANFVGEFTEFRQSRFRKGAVGRGFGYGDYVVVNALSSRMVVENFCSGESHRLTCERGVQIGELEYLGPCEKDGLRLRFLPDPEIFRAGVRLVRRRLLTELQELAALFPSLSNELVDRSCGKTRRDSFHFPGGISDLARLIAEEPVGSEPLRAQSAQARPEENGVIEVDFALQFQGSPSMQTIGFVNDCRSNSRQLTAGMEQGLENGFARIAKALGLSKIRPQKGAVAIVSARLPGLIRKCSGDWVVDAQAQSMVAALIAETLEDWASRRPAEARRVWG